MGLSDAVVDADAAFGTMAGELLDDGWLTADVVRDGVGDSILVVLLLLPPILFMLFILFMVLMLLCWLLLALTC